MNLSFNKINIYKDLYDEFKKDYIWIDLDTIICKNIDYINNLSNVFIENGGSCVRKNGLFNNNSSIFVPRNKYIQGNIWKLNINLYNDLIKTLEKIISKKLILRYDLQDLFNYYIYIENNNNKINKVNIIGNNIHSDTINGLSIWSSDGNSHPNLIGLNNLYYKNNELKSLFYPNKKIHILSFTFNTMKILSKQNKFHELFYNNL